MSEIDEIERAAALAEAETGARGGGAKLRLCLSSSSKLRGGFWTPKEDAFLRQNYMQISDIELGRVLGRTATAVKLHMKRDMHLDSRSKHPEFLSAEHVAMGLGVDGKSVHALMDCGLMPHRRLPEEDVTRVIDRRAFLLWLLNPRNWCYVKLDRVGAMRPRGKRGLTGVYDFEFWEDARRLVSKARARWKDEWLSPGQCVLVLGLTRKNASNNVSRAILLGNLKATRWGNWWVRKSDLPEGMTVNAKGEIVKAGSIVPVRCGLCGGIGHNRRGCTIRAAGGPSSSRRRHLK